MKRLIYLTLSLIGFTSISGCIPDGPDYIDDFDVVYTNYDDQFAFGGKLTYAIPDSVVEINGAALLNEPLDFIKPTYGNLIIDRIKSNMASRGYQLVSDPAQADFVIFPGSFEVTNVTYYYDYWYYYYGWYYPPGYGGWYYPFPSVSSYTTGTLVIPMIDNKNTNPSGRSRVVWVGIINGVLEGVSTDFSGRINKTIDQAFTQSPYLHP